MEDIMKKVHKIFASCAMGVLVLASQNSIAKAEEIPLAGIDIVLHNYFQNDENAANIENYLLNELNQYKGLSFAMVTDYVNIRSIPSEDGTILGKLYNNSSATIHEISGDWYKVKSGTVTGYIKADYLVIGEEAEKLAKEIGTRVALVTTDTLKVREKPSIEATVLTLIAKGDQYIVEEEKNGWVKIAFEGDKTGFVSADYIEVKYEYEEAISIEEEQERLIAEQEAEQEAIRAEQRRIPANREVNEDVPNTNNNVNSYSNSNQTSTEASGNPVYSKGNTNVSEVRNKIVEYALRFEGNPYVWGGTSLTKGADCSGFTQSVFRDNGISIPRTSRTQAIGGRRISIDKMQPGDLIFYDKNGTINHVGIYIGNGKVIAASSPETGIRITNYNYRRPYRVVSYFYD